MLAYVFWHRPRDGIESAVYEAGLRAFHRTLTVRSACLRLSALPFSEQPGYEDWYLVESWQRLGELNRAAISGDSQAPHDAIAKPAGAGWGGVYALVRGDAQPPLATRWISKRRDETYDAFLGKLQAPTVWQRQMVLGPAPEFCVVHDDDVGAPGSDPKPGRAIVYWEGE